MRTHPLILLVVFLLAALATGFAQSVNLGTIEGRVLNADSGEYLENARLTVEGTSLEAFTDAEGNFRLTNVPVGRARVRTFYTGLPPHVDEIAVTSGTPVLFEISLSSVEKKPAA